MCAPKNIYLCYYLSMQTNRQAKLYKLDLHVERFKLEQTRHRATTPTQASFLRQVHLITTQVYKQVNYGLYKIRNVYSNFDLLFPCGHDLGSIPSLSQAYYHISANCSLFSSDPNVGLKIVKQLPQMQVHALAAGIE